MARKYLKKSEEYFIISSLDTVANHLMKQVHAPSCEGRIKYDYRDEKFVDYANCPATCKCNRTTKHQLNHKTAMVWTVANLIFELSDNIYSSFLEADYEDEIEKVIQRVDTVYSIALLHRKKHKAVCNACEKVIAVLQNIMTYINYKRNPEYRSWTSDTNSGSFVWADVYKEQYIPEKVRSLKLTRNFRR